MTKKIFPCLSETWKAIDEAESKQVEIIYLEFFCKEVDKKFWQDYGDTAEDLYNQGYRIRLEKEYFKKGVDEWFILNKDGVDYFKHLVLENN